MVRLTELVGIEQINITLIPNTADKTPIELTSDIIYHPLMANIQTKGALDKYPYITGEIVYDKNYLYQLSYDKRIRFFFNKNKFREYILDGMSIITYTDVTYTDTINANINTNIDIMLKSLFPTIYPASGNNINSLEQIIKGISPSMFSSIISTTINYVLPSALRFLSPALAVYYSYIKIGGQIHTVTRTIWLNDFVNHPLYRDLITGYSDFIKWQKTTMVSIDAEISQYINQVGKKIKTEFIYPDLTGQIFNGDSDISDISGISIKLNKGLEKLSSLKKPLPTSGIISMQEEKNNIITDIANKTIQLVKTYKNYNNDNSKNKQYFIDAIIEINESIEKNKKLQNNSINIPLELARELNAITSISIRINILTIIRDKYFKDSIETDSSLDTDEIKREMDSKFSEYKMFVDKIKKTVKPNYTTSNANLRSIMEYYSKGDELPKDVSNAFKLKTSDPKKLFNFSIILGYINDTYIKKKQTHIAFIKENFDPPTIKDKLDELLEVNSMYMDRPGKNPKYSIYVAIDLIKGELNDTNKNLINCEFYGDRVGILFDHAKHKTRYNKYELYQPKMFDLDKDGHVTKDGKKVVVPDTKKKEPDNILNPIEVIDPLGVGLLNKEPAVKGGNRTRRNRRKRKRSTRRLRIKRTICNSTF